jgi:hypothetical protein
VYYNDDAYARRGELSYLLVVMGRTVNYSCTTVCEL